MHLLLFHSGDRVMLTAPEYGYYEPVPAYVLKTVEIGIPFCCPHCGARLQLRVDTVHTYGYYLDFGHPKGCCIPFTNYQLKRTHSTCDDPWTFKAGRITNRNSEE